MKKTVNILITSIGSTTAQSVVKGSLTQKKYKTRIIGTDTHAKGEIAGSQFVDTYYQVPAANDEQAYIRTLSEIIEAERIDLLIPIHDRELEVISVRRRELSDSVYVLISKADTIATCNDKLRTYEFLKKKGFPALKTAGVPDPLKITDVLVESGIEYPFYVKPRSGVGSHEVYEIRNERELALIERVEDPIIQDKGQGFLYTVDLFCNHGQPIAAVPRKQFEARAGVDYTGESQYNKQLINLSCRIAKALRFHGPLNIQYFRNRTDCRVLEINPRFAASNYLTTIAGVNFPLFAIELAMGNVPKPIKKFRQISMCRYWEMAFWDESGNEVPSRTLKSTKRRDYP
jgi:carbamoyl-phosphate synthase large subunit